MNYEVIGPKGVILASGLTKRQADTYCANCGGKVRAENPAPAAKKVARKNPARKTIAEALPYRVEISNGKTFALDSRHKGKAAAVAAAQFLASRHPTRAVRVMKG